MPNGQDPWVHIIKLTQEVGELKGKVGSMDSHVSGQLSNIRGDMQRIFENHDSRINKNENEIAGVRGKASGIALAVSAFVSFIGAIFKIFTGGN